MSADVEPTGHPFTNSRGCGQAFAFEQPSFGDSAAGAGRHCDFGTAGWAGATGAVLFCFSIWFS